MKNKLPSNEGRCRGYVWKPEVQDVVDTSDVLQAGQSLSKATLRLKKKRYEHHETNIAPENGSFQ